MLRRWLYTLVLIASGTVAYAQEPITSFATVGRPEPVTACGRALARLEDKCDRHPCCGYGKTINDVGVQGHRATKVFYWGSGCEFFSEPCRTPPRDTRYSSAMQRKWNDMYGNGSHGGCKNCGQ